MPDKSLRKYLIWAFALAWPLQGLASWIARNEAIAPMTRQLGFTVVLAVSMFAPLAAVLLAKIPLRSIGWKPKLRGHVRWYLAAWLLPAVLCTLGAALYFLLFPGHFDLSGAYVAAAAGPEALAQLEGQGLTYPLYVLIQAVAALTYAPFINVIACLGEEVGWRGFLSPHLKNRFGRVGGLLLSGLIWGAWHWPVIVFGGYEYGLTYWGAPVLGPLLFCLFTTALGVLFDLLYEKTGSIWSCALAHGAINAFANLPSAVLDPASDFQILLGPFAIGLIGGLPLLLLAAWVLLKKPSPRSADHWSANLPNSDADL